MIAIVDYGMGNLRSVAKAVERMGGEAKIVTAPEDVLAADKVILPGVGAFADAMIHLRKQGLVDPLKEFVDSGRPLLGICLGLQLLFTTGYEDGEHEGLGILEGKVVRFDFSSLPAGTDLAIPHMGWNAIDYQPGCPLYDRVESGSYVYFVHSYYVVPADESVIATRTDYGYPFVSSVWRDNLFATQFHPEKSQAIGLKMVENFVRL